MRAFKRFKKVMRAFKRFKRDWMIGMVAAVLMLVPLLALSPIQAKGATPESGEPPVSLSAFATSVDKNFQQPFASAARTVTATSSTLEIYGAETLVCYLSVTAASGTTPTLDVKFQDSPDGGTTWFDIAGASFTQATGATTQVVSASRKFARKIRCVATIGGTTPSFTFSVTIMTY